MIAFYYVSIPWIWVLLHKLTLMPFFHANLSYFPRYACMSFFRANLSYFPIVECIQKCLLVSLILEWILIDGLSFPFLTKLVTNFFKVQYQFYSNSTVVLLSNNFTLQLQLITPSYYYTFLKTITIINLNSSRIIVIL